MIQYLKTIDNDWYKPRLAGIFFIITAAFAVLFIRLFYLQMIRGEELRRLSENNCIRLQLIDPPRGLIFDRNGYLLSDNRPSFDLAIIPKDAKPIESTIGQVSRLIDVSPKELLANVSHMRGVSGYNQILLRADIGRNALAMVEARKFELPGISVRAKTRRHYPGERFAAHLLGYIGEIGQEDLKSDGYRSGDLIGKFGAEKAFESYLRGRPGGRQVEVNATGQVVRTLKTLDAEPGKNIFLTIDLRLQKMAEELMQKEAGAVVAMDPATGEVLALVSSPPFDPNAFIGGISHERWLELLSNPYRPLENKAIQGEYPPASTYKIVTALAGLEEGVIDEKSTFYCPGFYKFGDRVFRCWKDHGHGTVNVHRALSESCDVFFYQVGERLGVDRIAHYAKALGLGEPTGIELDHEARGLIPTAAWKKKRLGSSWMAGETLSIAIGQGYNLTTPLQMAVLTSAIANNGVRVTPRILHRIDMAGESEPEKKIKQTSVRVPVKKQTLDAVRKGIWEVVNIRSGTAWSSRIPGIHMSGKTGTAQVVSRRQKANDSSVPKAHKPHAWFVAYAPSENPKIAVAVIVEHGEGGSSKAAPIAAALIRAYLEGMHGKIPAVSEQENL